MRGANYLTRPSQYALVYSKGGTWVNHLIVLRVLRSGRGVSRYGLSVSKRLGIAVVRNRTKRQFREILRQVSLKPGWDVVFIARPQGETVTFQEWRLAMLNVLNRAQLIEEHEKAGSETDKAIPGGDRQKHA
jgi:ribonuclease P protein component